VKDPQVIVDEHQRGRVSSWFRPAMHSSLEPPRPTNTING
jgi:hypothetical protein